VCAIPCPRAVGGAQARGGAGIATLRAEARRVAPEVGHHPKRCFPVRSVSPKGAPEAAPVCVGRTSRQCLMSPPACLLVLPARQHGAPAPTRPPFLRLRRSACVLRRQRMRADATPRFVRTAVAFERAAWRRCSQVQVKYTRGSRRSREGARGGAARAVQLGHGLRFRGELRFNSQQCDALLGSPCAAARNAGRACARAGVLAERASPRFHEKKRTCERGGTKLRNCTGFLGSCLHCPFSGPPGTWLRN
jgi:hypothetical protein